MYVLLLVFINEVIQLEQVLPHALQSAVSLKCSCSCSCSCSIIIIISIVIVVTIAALLLMTSAAMRLHFAFALFTLRCIHCLFPLRERIVLRY